MKTYKAWKKSGVGLDEYLGKEPVRIDAELHLHILGIVPSEYADRYCGQCGEASFKEDGTYYHTTVYRANDKYFYIGELPSLNH